MLVTALTKLCSEVCSSFFQHRSGNTVSSVKRKLNVKSFGEKCQALRDLQKGLSNKDASKNMVYPETRFQRGLKTNQSILLHWNNIE